MLFHALLRRPVAGSFALIAFAATSAAAGAADVTITDAKIEAGKLVIAGTTAAPNTWVRLDGQTGSTFNVKSSADGAFGFAIVYHPGDCIVGLQKLISPTSLGEATDALVANCGPQGLVPRGAWSGAASYQTNDLVTSLGSSWRAKRSSLNKPPAANAPDWEQFAAVGAAGPAGPEGPAGPAGSNFASLAPPTGPAGGALTGTYPNPGIANLAVTLAKIANLAVSNAKISNGAVSSIKVLNDTAPGGGLAAIDLQTNSVGSAEIQTDGVQASEIADNSIDSGEIVDFTLTNQDVGVLFAEVNANATLANQCSGCGVTVTRVGAVGAGTYEVDFARNIATSCTAVGGLGNATTTTQLGQISVVDRFGNAEALFVETNNSAGASADLAFRVVVVC